MGLFSIFKKSVAAPGAADVAATPAGESDDDAARLAANSETARYSQQARQRDIARATAMKIDAIESAMTFDIFNQPEPAWGTARPPRPRPAPDPDDPGTEAFEPLATTLLLGDDELPEPAVAAETAPVVEEIAILYANGQLAVAEQMLADSLAAGAGQDRDRTVWWMLFDLYQVSGQQERFDNLSIDYASTFETSPPPWRGPAPSEARTASAASSTLALALASSGWAGVTPTLAFSGQLDGHIAAQLARLPELARLPALAGPTDPAGHSPPLRLEFGRVDGISADGCALLLAALRQAQERGCELILAGADVLVARLRAAIAVGRRADTEAPWLLLLELLQLQQREKDFEETAMDYCVTFEVSPPSFVARPRAAVAAPADTIRAPASPDRFMLPALMEHRLDSLAPAIERYAERYPALVFDCSRLVRIDYACANALLAQLQPLARAGRKIALRDVNHLVAALLRLLGYGNIARLYPHKY